MLLIDYLPDLFHEVFLPFLKMGITIPLPYTHDDGFVSVPSYQDRDGHEIIHEGEVHDSVLYEDADTLIEDYAPVPPDEKLHVVLRSELFPPLIKALVLLEPDSLG